MNNPFLKKNPFMNAWLSGENAVAGSIRGHTTAQAKRQLAAATKKSSKDVLMLLSGTSPAAASARLQKKRS